MKISPSQVSAYATCPRAWGFDKLDGIPRRDDPSTALGTEVHDCEEDWLKFKRPPDKGSLAGRIAHAMTADLPVPPLPECDVESHSEFEYGGIVYHGYPDAKWNALRYSPSIEYLGATHGLTLQQCGRVMVVRDHKSTSDLKWIHARDVVTDSQRIIYSYAELHRDPSLIGVLFEWGYGETKSSKGKHRTHVVRYYATRERIKVAMAWLHETYGIPIAEAYARNEPDTLRRDFTACSMYRGCHYLGRETGNCHAGIPPQKRLASIVSVQSLKDRLAQRRRELGLEPAANESQIDTPAETKSDEPPADTRTEEEKAPKRRGRPPGSTNKPKVTASDIEQPSGLTGPALDPDNEQTPPEPAKPRNGAGGTSPTPAGNDAHARECSDALLRALESVAGVRPPERRVAILKAALVIAESGS